MDERTTKTFLFTDIVGSTQLWESAPDLMPATMDRHDTLTLAVLDAHGGRISDHTGDGVFAVLDDPSAGVAAAVELQLRFTRESWPHDGPLLIRCGVHTGTAVARGTHLSGAEIHRAARIMQAAAGSQILVSEATMEAARAAVSDRIGFRPYGTVALRGLRHAERIFEVTHPDLVPPAPDVTQRRPGPGRTAVVVVERDRELAVLDDRWASARHGAGSVVVVAGEAGIGKSTLIRAFLDDLEAPRVLRGVCDDLSTRRTFGAVRDLALDATGPLASVAFEDRDSVFAALLAEVRQNPTIIVIEDAHWADDATLDAIQLLARRADSLPLLLVTSTRPPQPGQRSVFEVTGSTTATTTLTLEPLSEQGVAIVAAGSSMSTAELYALTGGNPFFVTELLATHYDEIPTSIREAVLTRIRPLPEDTRDALDQLSVVPGTVDLWLVDLLVEQAAALDPAEASGVLVVDRHGVRFRNELARQAVLDVLPSERRRRLHEATAAALEAAEADHATIVHHASAARDSVMIMRHVEAAIKDAIYTGSPTQALELVDILEEQEAVGGSALLGWAETQRANALIALDRTEAALASARRAVDLLTPGGPSLDLAEAYRTLGRIAWWLRDFDVSRPAANEALAVLDQLEPNEEGAVVRSRLAYLMALSQDPRAADAARRALRVASEVGSPRASGSAEIALGLAGGGDDMAAHLLRAIEKAREAGDTDTETRATTNLASHYTHSHRYVQAAEWLPVAVRLSRSNEQLAALSVAFGLQPWLQALRGELEASLPGFDAFIAEMDNQDHRAWGQLHKGIVLARLGRHDEAVQIIEAARGRRIGRSANPDLVFEAARAEVWWLAGLELDGERMAEQVLWPNRFDRPEDYVGRLGRNLTRAGFPVARFDFHLAGYAEGMWGDPSVAARIWEEIGNPYEQGMELAAAGAPQARDVLESIGASGAIQRLFAAGEPDQ